jgi:hypothetical protein
MPNCASIIEAIVGGEADFVELCCAVVVKQAANRAKATVVDRTSIRGRLFLILITASEWHAVRAATKIHIGVHCVIPLHDYLSHAMKL